MVYFFRKYDINNDEFIRSKRPATREAIDRVRGEVLEDTAIQIDDSEVDGDGFRKKRTHSNLAKLERTRIV